MRQFLTIAVPLLLPTALYFFYLTAIRRRSAVGGAGDPPRVEVPWLWLAAAGVALLLVTVGVLSYFHGAPPGSRYEPARTIDGRIQEGTFDSPAGQPAD